MSKPGAQSGTLAEQAEALRGVEALAGDEAAMEMLGQKGGEGPPSPPAAAVGERPNADEAIGRHVARGFSFMLAQAMVTRVVGFACQIALAHLLLPKHFGLVALADTVAIFANLLQLIGIKEILVARQKKFELYSSAAFWITVVTGFTTGAIVAAAGPVAAWAFSEPDLPGLMLVLAISLPLWAIGLVPEARIQSQLRFRFIAALIGMQATLTPVLTVAFALAGLGPYAFVLPRVVVGAIRLVLLLRAAGLRFPRRVHVRRWKYIISSSVVIFCTSLLLTVVQIGERPALGLFVPAEIVGLYFFAFSISLQTVMLISVNLEQVLFATLARIRDDPERLLRAFLRASKVLASIVVPLCLIQSAVSDAAVRTVFSPRADPTKWFGAIPAMQILGLGMIFPGAFCPATAMLQAQQRFKTRLKLAIVHSSLYMVAVFLGVILGRKIAGNDVGAVTGVGAAVAITYAIISPIWTYVTTRPLGGTWGTTFGIISRPLLASAIAVGLGLAAGSFAGRAAGGRVLFGRDIEHWVRLFVIGGVSSLAYVPLMRMIMPEEFTEVAVKLVALARRASPRAAGAMARVAGLS